MNPGFSLNGKTMKVIQTASVGKVNQETVFYLKQTGEVVTATYAEGRIVAGSLVGKLTGQDLEFRYAQIDTDGVLDGGHSRCRVETGAKLRIVENFTWESTEGSGTNIWEEV